MNDNNEIDSVLRVEARAWVVRLQSRDGVPDLDAQFEDWCSRSPEHKAAYLGELANHKNTVVLKSSERHGAEKTAWMLAPTSYYWLKAGAVAAAVLIAVSVVFAGGTQNLSDSRQQTTASLTFEPFVTRRGEIKIFRLSDGSVATLDTDSKVQVSMTREHRFLRLAQGRARFQVAADSRPFVVSAGAGQVVARTGSFDMAYHDNELVTVQLINGDAHLRPTAEFASFRYKLPTRMLTSEMPISYNADSFSEAKIDVATGKSANKDWPSGWVEYRSIRLDVLIEQANAYAVRPIKLDDVAIGNLKISGRFKISDTGNFVERVCELFDLNAIVSKDGIHLRKL